MCVCFVQVTFADGVNSTQIVLTVHADNVPELDEVTRIQLTQVTRTDGDAGRQAIIDSQSSSAVVTVLANDEPHGVVRWSPGSVNSTAIETEGSNNVINLMVIREFGTVGDIIVSYE